jgi:Transposase IS116/IS110/IS902 family
LIDQIYGVGALTAVTILAELGDVHRFENSRDVVRYAGPDVTVYQSDDHRAPGHLSRKGPPALRWALYEAAQRARFPASPDRAYYQQLAARIGGNRAASHSRASCSNAATTSSKNSSTRARARRLNPVTRQARDQPMNRAQLPARLLPTRRSHEDGPERLSGRITICRNTPSKSCRRPGANPGRMPK